MYCAWKFAVGWSGERWGGVGWCGVVWGEMYWGWVTWGWVGLGQWCGKHSKPPTPLPQGPNGVGNIRSPRSLGVSGSCGIVEWVLRVGVVFWVWWVGVWEWKDEEVGRARIWSSIGGEAARQGFTV